MSRIHPTAIVDPAAELHETVEIGPYAVVGPHVKLGEGTWVGPHAVIEGHTTIGRFNRIFQFASVGAVPQDLKYKGQPTELQIGDGNLIREFTTLNLGTVEGGGVTRIGNRNLFMAYVHVGHDTQIGNGCIFANCATLGGHVVVEDHVHFGGLSAAHQFTRFGAHAFVSGGGLCNMDVPPFTMVTGAPASLVGLNTIGLQRSGFSDEQIRNVKRAFRILFREGLVLKEAVAQVRSEIAGDAHVDHMLRFVESSERGVTRRA